MAQIFVGFKGGSSINIQNTNNDSVLRLHLFSNNIKLLSPENSMDEISFILYLLLNCFISSFNHLSIQILYPASTLFAAPIVAPNSWVWRGETLGKVHE